MFIVYRMGRLCGGAHEISGIPAPLWLHGWVVKGFMGWVGVGVGGMFVLVGCVGWICITHTWSLTLFPWGILIFQGVLTE